jgi:hypothetical protein
MQRVDTVYLSPQLPRVPLATEQQLVRAVTEGLLEESHFIDLKRELKAGKGENRELARDLASFAIDGGTLLIGVDEEADGSAHLSPVALDGLAERVEQVAHMVPDPPLAVVTKRIGTQADPSVGYLVVHVPTSPAAPHMVDNRYIGRGDKTKRYLSDSEVLRLHEQRRSTQDDAMALLDAEFRRDPVPQEARSQSHLFLLAEPLTGRPEMLLHIVEGDGWQQRLLDFARRSVTPELQQVLAATVGGFSPDIGQLQSFDRRPDGAALTTYGLASGRVLREDTLEPENVAELEVDEDGGLRMFTSRLSARLGHDNGEQLVFDVAPVLYVRRLIALTVAAAQEAGYFGNWVLAVGATGLEGRQSVRQSQEWTLSPRANRYASGHLPTSSDCVLRRTDVATRCSGGSSRWAAPTSLRNAPTV